jgi:hypothetical protein
LAGDECKSAGLGSSAVEGMVACLVCLAGKDGTVVYFVSSAVGRTAVCLENFAFGPTAAHLASSAVGCMAGHLGCSAEKEFTVVHLGCLAGEVERAACLWHCAVGNSEACLENTVGALEDDIAG